MDFETMRERMRVATDSCGTAAEIIDACAKVALDALDVPSGWPSGWSAASNGATLCYPGVTYSVASVAVQPFSGGGFYASIEGPLCSTEDTALDGARRAIWAMMGRGASTIDREALAAALHDAYVADEAIVWGERCEDVRQGYRREADTAIRLCAGADAGARIADLEARIATLTATANAAVERAEAAEATIRLWEEESVAIHEALQEVGAPLPTAKAEARIRGMKRQIVAHTAEATEQHVAEAIRAILDGKGYNATGMGDALYAAMRALKNRILESDIVIKDRDAATAHAAQMQTDRREMIDHAERLLKRAEEAEVRAAKAEKALRLSADAAEAATTDEEDARRDLYEARKENRRLRHALSAALRGAQHIATAADLLLGEENADA